MEVLKTKMGWALSNRFSEKYSCPWQWGWNKVVFKGPLQPKPLCESPQLPKLQC